MQTVNKTTSDTGMFHFEGGWPREINPRDEEITYRFRRRVERGENWLPKMQSLADVRDYEIIIHYKIPIVSVHSKKKVLLVYLEF